MNSEKERNVENFFMPFSRGKSVLRECSEVKKCRLNLNVRVGMGLCINSKT